MIDGIRRRFGRTTSGDPWGADQDLNPELEEDITLPTDGAVLVAANDAVGRYVPDDIDTPDYYKSLVQTALENGGKHGDHRISIPWLRMILAGLESKHIDPEMMWYGIEAGDAAGNQLPEVPPYENLFPSGGEAPTRPR